MKSHEEHEIREIVDKVRQGDIRTVARLIREIDDHGPTARPVLKSLFPFTGRAFVLGITGAPGVGKSTLTDGLIKLLRDQNLTVGVLAVDPTSPFTGGAILGDRLRMQRHGTDEEVFIRSMATRGQFGGLTQSTRGAIMVLDAMGKDVIIVETVGVGQDEVDIARTAHTTVIVMAPGMGDDIQAIKAGILEVGDVFAINKADKDGADRTMDDIRGMLELAHAADTVARDWTPPVIKTTAKSGQGLTELWSAILLHREFLSQGGGEYHRRLIRLKTRMEVMDLIKQGVVETIVRKLDQNGDLDRYVEDLVARKADPYTVSEEIMARVFDYKYDQ
ncbi:MAG: methylmalonyl Co-A mutase-associated GTPase MeaB [Deltaproteobacteria bacterium]|nr:methylmalonyl Co-A mutase-associated GTPase MeaB [Deltaproteobacteria bacterium]